MTRGDGQTNGRACARAARWLATACVGWALAGCAHGVDNGWRASDARVQAIACMPPQAVLRPSAPAGADASADVGPGAGDAGAGWGVAGALGDAIDPTDPAAATDAPDAPRGHACSVTVYDGGAYVQAGGRKVVVLRLPASTPLHVHAAGSASGEGTLNDGGARSAAAWAEHLGAMATFNAGFYQSASSHVGWLKGAGTWHQRARARDWQGLVVSGPNADAQASAAATRLVDMQAEGSAASDAYDHVAQTMVLYAGDRALRVRNSVAAASRSVLATDADGALYVAVTQGAWTLAALAQWLQQTLPQLVLALNLDGGHEAQLALQGGGEVLEFAGEHGSRSAWLPKRRALPFVLAAPTVAPAQ